MCSCIICRNRPRGGETEQVAEGAAEPAGGGETEGERIHGENKRRHPGPGEDDE